MKVWMSDSNLIKIWCRHPGTSWRHIDSLLGCFLFRLITWRSKSRSTRGFTSETTVLCSSIGLVLLYCTKISFPSRLLSEVFRQDFAINFRRGQLQHKNKDKFSASDGSYFIVSLLFLLLTKNPCFFVLSNLQGWHRQCLVGVGSVGSREWQEWCILWFICGTV